MGSIAGRFGNAGQLIILLQMMPYHMFFHEEEMLFISLGVLGETQVWQFVLEWIGFYETKGVGFFTGVQTSELLVDLILEKEMEKLVILVHWAIFVFHKDIPLWMIYCFCPIRKSYTSPYP